MDLSPRKLFLRTGLTGLFVLFMCALLVSGCINMSGSTEITEKAAESEATKDQGEVEAEVEDLTDAEQEVEEEEVAEESLDDDDSEEEEEEVVDEAEVARLAAVEEADRIAAEEEAIRIEAEEEAKRIADEKEKRRRAFEEAKIYDVVLDKLSTKDCIRCHISQYSRIVDKGGLHQTIVCTDCHREFHAYNPRKGNYEEIMPKCFWCHDEPHGNKRLVLRCLNCHADPHQPIESVVDPAQLEPNCRTCHADIAALLENNPTKHTEQECSSCHSEKHGRIPECKMCHENHSPELEMKTPDCLVCHPVHTPLRISYPATQSKKLCKGCHEQQFLDLEERITKHSAFTCAKCHPQHGQLMACQDCHGESVHGVKIHKRFEACGECHSIAHKLDK